MGWDFNQIASTQVKDYVLDAPLKAESYVAATLTWNRQVDLNDSNGDGRYDINESFRDRASMTSTST